MPSPSAAALEMSFSSTNSQGPTMNWAYSDDPPGGTWQPAGQAKMVVASNTPIRFYVYDTGTYNPGQKAPSVAEVTITGWEKHTGEFDTPFSSWQNNPEGFTGPPALTYLGPNANSVGLNLQNVRGWQVGPFEADQTGDYQFAVNVTLNNGTQFSVDPEMEVTGG